MSQFYLASSVAGPNRDLTKGSREQSYWDQHAEFIDQLVDEGFIVMGGPIAGEGGALLIVKSDSEAAVRQRLRNDPWTTHGILKLVNVQRWEIFIDELHR